jgi:hypothetical protein
VNKLRAKWRLTMAVEAQGPGIPAHCDFCRRGTVVRRSERLRFSQRTDRGAVPCRVRLTIGRCDAYGGAHLEPAAEARIEAAVLHAYLKLRPG